MRMRIDDLDGARCHSRFIDAALEDLEWLGLDWRRDPSGILKQSNRLPLYKRAFEQLKAGGYLYPCDQSRRDIMRSLNAPHRGDEEPVYPGTCRPGAPGEIDIDRIATGHPQARINWRFKTPEEATVQFQDGHFGPQQFVFNVDFGDFIVWRHDDLPSYQLATAVDDALLQITEVVRGADLLTSTARQILLLEALGYPRPNYFHCPLMNDENGQRLAKRHKALSLKQLRENGMSAAEVLQLCAKDDFDKV